MPRIPFKLVVFVITGTILWIRFAPQRAEQAMGIFRRRVDTNSEASARILIEDRIRRDICSLSDLREYRPAKWLGFHRPDAGTLQLEHHFFCDGALHHYLFRIRGGSVAEVINLR